MLKNITIYKRKEVTSTTQPTHDLVASDEKFENKTTVGAMWTKVTDEGNKFLSGSLSKNRTGTDGKVYKGYVLISEDEYNELLQGKVKVAEVKVSNGEVDMSEIDF